MTELDASLPGTGLAFDGIADTPEPPTVTVTRGWDLGRERAAWRAASLAGRPHLSVRLHGRHVVLGPLWVPGTTSGCAGCAEARTRIIADHPLLDAPEQPQHGVGAETPVMSALVEAATVLLRAAPLAAGELYQCGGTIAAARHRVLRSSSCPVCRPAPEPIDPACPPTDWRSASRPAVPENPTRTAAAAHLTAGTHLRDRVVDPAYGPVLGTLRDINAPFAMSSAINPDAKAWGYGRARTFAEAEPIALLEVYERLSGFPHEAALLTEISTDELQSKTPGLVLDPATLGGYTPEQLAHPMSRVLPGGPDTPRDWVWAHALHDGSPLLVPAEVGFYQYGYQYRRRRHSLRHDAHPDRRQQFQPESSSGCALGANLEEATLHSLFELAERDAFLRAFHRARPLPVLDPASLPDPVTGHLLDGIHARGFDTYLLSLTGDGPYDIDLPAVWAMAINRTGGYPASWSAAGSGTDPGAAVRAALWELAQIVREPPRFDRSHAETLLVDPYRVDELEDHMALYALPERLPRIMTVLGGPTRPVDELFPDARARFAVRAGGDVRGALRHVAELFAHAGMPHIAVVDQTTREHRDIGLAAAKAVVPGIVPLTFGHAQQRLTGIARLAGLPGQAPYDPHPFP
jgi:ribosomal protein S12 methylthiotransferase accessory factor